MIEDTLGNLRALFHFYALPTNPGVPTGCFTMSGQQDPSTGRVTLRGGQWRVQPPTYQVVDLVGTVDPSGRTFSGRVGRGYGHCTMFQLNRTVAAPDAPKACHAGEFVIPTQEPKYQRREVLLRELEVSKRRFKQIYSRYHDIARDRDRSTAACTEQAVEGVAAEIVLQLVFGSAQRLGRFLSSSEVEDYVIENTIEAASRSAAQNPFSQYFECRSEITESSIRLAAHAAEIAKQIQILQGELAAL